MAARGNLQLCPTLRKLDEEEESPHSRAAPTKLVPVPILYLTLSNSSGLLILNTDEVVSYQPLGEVYLGFKLAGVFRACGHDQGRLPWTRPKELFRKVPLDSSNLFNLL